MVIGVICVFTASARFTMLAMLTAFDDIQERNRVGDELVDSIGPTLELHQLRCDVLQVGDPGAQPFARAGPPHPSSPFCPSGLFDPAGFRSRTRHTAPSASTRA